MKNLIYVIILLLGFKNAIGQNYPVDLYEFIPAFSDEFTSSTLNSNLWRTTHWDGQPFYAERVHFVSSCVTVGNSSPTDPSNTTGFMRITPYSVNTPDTRTDMQPNQGNTYSKTYYSGDLINLYSYRYGYYETRLKLPSEQNGSTRFYGTTSWWAHGGCHQILWPNAHYNEFDVIETEFYNKPIQDGGTLIQVGTGTLPGGNCSYGNSYGTDATSGYTGSALTSNLISSFHTFGFEWMPDYVKVYIDGNLYREVKTISYSKGTSTDGKLYGDNTPVNIITTPVEWKYWVKRGPAELQFYPDGSKYLEVDYFRYYKPKPFLTTVTGCADNTVTLTAGSVEPSDVFTWSISGAGSINSTFGSNGTFNLPPIGSTGRLTVTATGQYPPTSATKSYNIIQSNGSICSFGAIGVTPTLYKASTFTIPQFSCSSTIISTGMNITLAHCNGVLLDKGFEVQLGAELNILK